MRFLDLLENNLFFSAGDKGDNPEEKETEEKKDPTEDKDEEGGEEKITLTKAEFEERLKQKYAEGARKASQGKLDPKENAEKEETKPNEEITAIKQEVEVLRAEKIAGKVGIKAAHQEDLIALVRGKGLELTEENIKKEAERHKEWLTSNDETRGGVQKIGSPDGETVPPKADEKEAARKLWGLN